MDSDYNRAATRLHRNIAGLRWHPKRSTCFHPNMMWNIMDAEEELRSYLGIDFGEAMDRGRARAKGLKVEILEDGLPQIGNAGWASVPRVQKVKHTTGAGLMASMVNSAELTDKDENGFQRVILWHESGSMLAVLKVEQWAEALDMAGREFVMCDLLDVLNDGSNTQEAGTDG